MEVDETIFCGKTFDSKHDLCEAVKKFNRDNFTDFLIETSKKQEITFPCKRGGKEHKSKSKGIRPAQHYNNLGCPAMIRCYRSIAKNATGSVKITAFNNNHNHVLDKELWKLENVKLTKDEEELVGTLANAGCKASNISRVMKGKSGKELSTKKVRNLIR